MKPSLFAAAAIIALSSLYFVAEATSKKPLSAGAASEKIWVKINSGDVACENPKVGHSLDEDKKKLTDAKVKVFESKAGNDGQMRAAVCGIPKGDEHHFLIERGDLKVAEKLGFVSDAGAVVEATKTSSSSATKTNETGTPRTNPDVGSTSGH